MISLLLRHSSAELAQEVLYKYAQEGRAAELAVLLYADSIFGVDKFASLDCVDYKALRLSFAEEVVKLYQEESVLVDPGNGRLTECVNKRKGMISVLLLLEVFQRTNLHVCEIISIVLTITLIHLTCLVISWHGDDWID